MDACVILGKSEVKEEINALIPDKNHIATERNHNKGLSLGLRIIWSKFYASMYLLLIRRCHVCYLVILCLICNLLRGTRHCSTQVWWWNYCDSLLDVGAEEHQQPVGHRRSWNKSFSNSWADNDSMHINWTSVQPPFSSTSAWHIHGFTGVIGRMNKYLWFIN